MAGRGGTFEVIELAGAEPGPTVALLGGIHGDEEEGVLAVQRVCARLAERPPARGTIRAVAVAHPAAYAANARTSPLDGRNLAREFPGGPAGGPTRRLAHELTEQVIAGSDLLIDLHSAGAAYGMPTFAGYIEDGDELSRRSRQAALAFGAPLLWEHPGPVAPGRTISTAISLGIPCLYVEGSGGGSVTAAELSIYVDGVLRVLADLGMLTFAAPTGGGVERVVRGAGNLDAGIEAPCDGRFLSACAAGEVLAPGARVGEILDEDGRAVAEITAPEAATVMFLRRAARVAEGEILAAFGAPSRPWKPDPPDDRS
jgi:predicted deacylase